ncbi:MAG: hypothetical protein ACLR7N_13645 [Roseburia hominis]
MDVNQKELAAILGITARRIRQLREEYGLFEHGLAAGKRSKDIASKNACRSISTIGWKRK